MTRPPSDHGQTLTQLSTGEAEVVIAAFDEIMRTVMAVAPMPVVMPEKALRDWFARYDALLAESDERSWEAEFERANAAVSVTDGRVARIVLEVSARLFALYRDNIYALVREPRVTWDSHAKFEQGVREAVRRFGQVEGYDTWLY